MASPASRTRTPSRLTRRDVLRLGGAALSGLAAAALIGCGGDDDDDGEEGGGRSLLAPDTPIPANLVSGVLRVGVVGTPEVPRELTYAGLVAVDPRTAEIHGDLAERVEQPDPLTITFRLRENANFHPNSSGESQPITAAEVANDFEVRGAAQEFLFGDAVASIETPDAQTLRIQLAAPYAVLFELLGDPVAAGIRARAPSDLGLPLGSGPFVPTRREDGGLSLLAHPAYHLLGLPVLDEVRIISASRDRALDAAFESGSLDLRAHVSGSVLAEATTRDDAVVATRSSRRVRGLGLSLVGAKNGVAVRSHPAFQDPRVRRALALSLDQEALAAIGDSQLAGPVGPGHAADALPPNELGGHSLYRRDLREARKLTEAAGYSPLIFHLEAPRQQPLRGLAQMIAQQLREGPFLPQLELVEEEQWQRDVAAGDFESVVVELEPLRTPDLGLRLHLSAGLEGTFSPWGYSNPFYDEAVRQTLLAVDPAERAELARGAQRLLLDDVPALLPLPEPVDRVSLAGAVGGYEYDAYEFNERALSPAWNLGGDRAARGRPRLPLAVSSR